MVNYSKVIPDALLQRRVEAMSFDQNWDVEKYHYHYELPHHWELKKKFILIHKDKYPEDRLICLAQIFCNVHYLGCRYGEEVMELIDELANGLADQRHEKFEKKSFALASDAVEERVKARISGGQNSRPAQLPGISFVRASSESGPSTSIETIDLSDGSPDKKKRPAEDDNGNGPPAKFLRGNGPPPQPLLQENRNNFFASEARRARSHVQHVVDSGPFGKVVIFQNSRAEENAASIIERSVTAAHMVSDFAYKLNRDKYVCTMSLDGMYLATGEGQSQKLAKEAACSMALQRLKETSFTIQVKAAYVGGDSRIERDLEVQQKGGVPGKAGVDRPLAESNIGSKMLKLMGWTGGGLGKEHQGIEEPIRPYDQNIRRGGLGITNFSDFRKKIMRILEDYAHSDGKEDLVFSPDFSKDERKTIHELVRKYNLKSRSYGKEEELRHIVVFRKVQPLEIVQDLLMCGGETDKYRLVSPNGRVL